MEKRWVLKKSADAEIVKMLSSALNISRPLANLLAQRGVETYDEAERFFRPELSHLHDPFVMKDMDKAVSRIQEAIKKGEKIIVYGDYDVDGTTAVAVVYSFLKQFHRKTEFYIPDRYDEGYGISYKGIDYAIKSGVKLMITLDCGIKAVEKVAYAKKHGLDTIIGDHHRPGEKIPEAVAVLDPKQDDCPYPYKELSGCGVGFKLVEALGIKKGIGKEIAYEYLDLVAVSIAADIVAITGENRVLAYYGLKKINTNPSIGIYALLKSAGIKENTNPASKLLWEREINVNDLVFLLGPRINAAGRIESATDSVRLLISNNMEYADKLGRQIDDLNLTRRDLDSHITHEAVNMIKDISVNNKKATIVYKESWHKGVIGIVASRLVELFYKPTIVLTKTDGLITGSARSIKNFDIYDAIDSCSHLLEHFGGHTYAAGLAMKPENLTAFIDEFEKYAADRIVAEMLVPEIEIDLELFVSDINFKFFRIIRQFAPFGPGNMSPVFVTNNVIDTGYAKLVGRNNGQNHLKFSVVHPDRTGNPVPAIAFNQGHHLENMRKGKPFSICYHIDENTWQGNTSLQLRITDIKF
ncbi:MAG: single-stranded-DNA-specific exonuclease RecJ [Bacteroidetes bacterium]|nr:MAG: single-stranded-DNA-specific exonuclease RecJ [Bacteroidota bacterium]RLD45869.1 MAG: single-stranded-DNA-specific exonuclease RecJ [Bacteroidota bacterium]RLD73653.1 MAG: single-stranded-DNA-specific exonuclease RecJ [Bacteroidota bacterium]RLD88893.1 MAG: single-stranded-DNA-specific exonuclease RecJ [Bacteroidota bacterium]